MRGETLCCLVDLIFPIYPFMGKLNRYLTTLYVPSLLFQDQNLHFDISWQICMCMHLEAVVKIGLFNMQEVHFSRVMSGHFHS